MKTPIGILKYQQKCFATYSSEIGLPRNYAYIDGNPIRPLVPVATAQKSLMIVGAYPSARFESRENNRRRYLIPIGDNLAPFQPELYFDGVRSREQESANGLQQYFLRPLGIRREQCWITDLVKVFLFKPEHVDNYAALGRKLPFDQTRNSFDHYAKRSMKFLVDEIVLARPILVLTLGEEVARVITNRSDSSSDQLLTGNPYELDILGNRCFVAHVAHPDACRRWSKWRDKTDIQIRSLRTFLNSRTG